MISSDSLALENALNFQGEGTDADAEGAEGKWAEGAGEGSEESGSEAEEDTGPLALSAGTLEAMLRKEESMRLSKEVQARYAAAEVDGSDTDWMEVTVMLQRDVVRNLVRVVCVVCVVNVIYVIYVVYLLYIILYPTTHTAYYR